MVFTGLSFLGPDVWNFSTDPMILGLDEEDYNPGEGQSWIPRLASQASVGTIYYFDFAGRGCIPNLCALYLDLHVKNIQIPLVRRPWMLKHSPSQMVPIFKKPDDSLISDNDATKTMCKYICGLPSTNGRRCPINDVQDEIFEIANSPPIAHSRGNREKGDKYDANPLNPIFLQSIPPFNDINNLEGSLAQWAAATTDVFAQLDQRLTAQPGPFFSGSDPSYGDFTLWSSMDIVAQLSDGAWIRTLQPRMQKFYQDISALAAVEEWSTARKVHKYYVKPGDIPLTRVRQLFDDKLASGWSENKSLAEALRTASDDQASSLSDLQNYRAYLVAQGLQQALTKAVKQVLAERPSNAVSRVVEVLLEGQQSIWVGDGKH